MAADDLRNRFRRSARSQAIYTAAETWLAVTKKDRASAWQSFPVSKFDRRGDVNGVLALRARDVVCAAYGVVTSGGCPIDHHDRCKCGFVLWRQPKRQFGACATGDF